MGQVAVLLFFGLLACTGPGTAASNRRPIQGSFGTFNANLFRGATAFSERKELLLETLQARVKNRVPDVLCMQELLRRVDARDVVEAVSEEYPYHASLDNLFEDPSPELSCTPGDAAILGGCIAACGASTGDSTAFVNCTFVECNHRVLQIPNVCFACTTAENGAEGVDDPITHCATNVPASEYIKPHGVLILSRYPLQNIVTQDYNPDSTLRRGFVRASVPALRHDVICTHLTPYFGVNRSYSGPPQFESVHQQQANEVMALHEEVEGESRIVLLGDFNHGPATPGLHWEVPTNFGLMAARGLFSVNALWCGHCTFCNDNVLTGGAFPDLLIDHVYLPTGRASSVIRAERIFDDITSPSGLPLSDHFGVRALLYTRRGDTSTCRSSEVLGRDVALLDMSDLDFHIDESCGA